MVRLNHVSRTLLVPILSVVVGAFLLTHRSTVYTIYWSVAQWLPTGFTIRVAFEHGAWDHWEQEYPNLTTAARRRDMPTVDVQKHRENISGYLDQTYGRDWRQRPLLLKNLWTREELMTHNSSSSRHLSLESLLKEELVVPYFTDARQKGALAPDHHGKVKDIVRNMTLGKPHKIASQLILETYPNLIDEIAPLDIVRELFGDFFSANQIKGSGPWRLFPALITVPVFIANHGRRQKQQQATTRTRSSLSSSEEESVAVGDATIESRPFTALHCEPIGNIAVQLSGRKEWTFVQSSFWNRIKPSISPDGRAFFASWSSDYTENVPIYNTITAAGEAVWIPTWTWHRVDYIESDDIAIGGSLFHFRGLDFVRNNPLFAGLIVPSLIKELLGYKTQ